MSRILALLISGAVLAACAAPAPPPAPKVKRTVVPVGMTGCDDGGSGGVLIDGVCL